MVKLRRAGADFAFADVRLSGIHLRGLRVTRKDGVLSLSPPEQANGKGKSSPLYDLQPGWAEAILARISELWDQTEDADAAPATIEAAGIAAVPAAITSPGDVPGDAPAVEPAPAPDVEAPAAMRSFQADALLSGILDAEVDLSEFGEQDSKRMVASIIAAAPTVASLNNRKGVAAE